MKMKMINFTPEDFGGYTFFIVMSGVFLGYSYDQVYWGMVSIVMFLFAMIFYAKLNIKEGEE